MDDILHAIQRITLGLVVLTICGLAAIFYKITFFVAVVGVILLMAYVIGSRMMDSL